MKKLILLSAAGLLCFAADAQQSRVSVVRTDDATSLMTTQKEAAVFAGNRIAESRHKNNYKTTATAFYTETFGSGSATSLPTGWTATTGAGFTLTWRWTNIASPAPYNIGVLNSTSKSDGWMIYDSDSIGNTNPTVTPVTGSLISPVINCTGHSSVLLSFEEAFRQFQDSCFVDVSNNGGTSWTTFPVVANNALSANGSLPTNSYTARINISSVAANQSNVRLRFRYSGRYAGGSYNWLIDDVSLAELDPTEIGIASSGMFLYLGAPAPWRSYSLFSNYPLQLVDSLLPLTYMTNYGLNGQTGVVVNAKVFNGATNVYDRNQTFASLPAGALDSIVEWSDVALYKPTATGNYTAAFSVNHPGDAFAKNNVDTTRFSITDTMLTTYGPVGSGSSYYVHRSAADGEASFYQGVRFDIPAGKTDTLTSVSVSYDSRTTVGVNTVVQLYKVVEGATTGSFSWAPVISLRQKQLTAADISTTANRVYTTYVASSTGSAYILSAGTYAAVVSTVSAPANSTVLISSAVPMNNQVNVGGYFGQTDSSKNNSSFEFAQEPGTGLATGYTNVPLMRINFGRIVRPAASVATISGAVIGDAYPNPANNTLNVPVTASTGATVNVSLTNMVGQVLQSQSLGKISAGQSKTAVFNTSGLANGIYMYTVEANGERVTNRVVVAH